MRRMLQLMQVVIWYDVMFDIVFCIGAVMLPATVVNDIVLFPEYI